MTNQLIVLLGGQQVGIIDHKSGRLSLVYSQTWRTDPNSYPLSLSMPLASAEHGHARIVPVAGGEFAVGVVAHDLLVV